MFEKLHSMQRVKPSCPLTLFFMLLWSSADMSKLTFSKNSFRNAIIVSNDLDPDQNQPSVGPDLGPNCLQRLSADDKVVTSMERAKQHDLSFSHLS